VANHFKCGIDKRVKVKVGIDKGGGISVGKWEE
jgi:hypothetical protein